MRSKSKISEVSDDLFLNQTYIESRHNGAFSSAWEVEADFSPKICSLMRRAKHKLRGVIAMQRVYKELNLFGSSPKILEFKTTLKRDVSEFIKSRRRLVRSHTIEVKDGSRVFDPEKAFLQIWNSLMFVLLFYVIIGTPWIIAFEEVEYGSFLFMFELLVDMLFFCDILITMNSAYFEDDKKITDRKKIIINYLTGLFVIDVLSIFPFFLFEDSSTSSSNSLVRVIRIFKVVRILRTSKLIKIVNNLLSGDKFEKCLNFFETYRGVSRLIGGLFFILILVHFIACIWFWTAKMSDFEPDTWVVRFNFLDESKNMQYLASYYWAFTTLTTVGYGDITALTTSEKFICIIWMLFGVIIYSIIVGSITSVLSSMSKKNDHMIKKMNQIKKFGEYMKFSGDLIKKMIKVAKENTKFYRMDDIDRLDTIKLFPEEIQEEICFNMYNEAIGKIEFFRSKEIFFICSIVPRLHYLEKRSDRVIYFKDEYADAIYFIVEGRVNYLIDHDTIAFKTVFKGMYFGEFEVINDTPRLFSVMTETIAEFLVLPRYNFKFMKKNFPKVANEITSHSDVKIKRDLESKEEMEKALNHIGKKQNDLERFSRKRTTFDPGFIKPSDAKQKYSELSNNAKRYNTTRTNPVAISEGPINANLDLMQVQDILDQAQSLVSNMLSPQEVNNDPANKTH